MVECSTAQMGCSQKKICEQAGVEADHKSQLWELLENEGKDGR